MFPPPRSGQKQSSRKQECAGAWGPSAAAIVVANVKFAIRSCAPNRDTRLTANDIEDKVSSLPLPNLDTWHIGKVNYAQVCYRAGNAQCRQSVGQRVLCRCTEIDPGSPGNWPTDTVAAQLRHRQQDLLRLSGPRRSHHPKPREQSWYSCQSRLRSAQDA